METLRSSVRVGSQDLLNQIAYKFSFRCALLHASFLKYQTSFFTLSFNTIFFLEGDPLKFSLKLVTPLIPVMISFMVIVPSSIPEQAGFLGDYVPPSPEVTTPLPPPRVPALGADLCTGRSQLFLCLNHSI